MTFFCTWQAAFRKWFFGFPVIFHSVHVESIFPSSGSFPWISNVWRRLLVSHSIDPRVVVEFERHLHPTMFAIRCLQTFSVVSTFFVSHVKIVTFEFFKPFKALWFTKSMFTVSFDKHSMRFCSSFLQTKNQCCPQIVVSRHKIWHVQRYYKLYCCWNLYCCKLKVFVRY